jgi:hypothetical protein
LIVAHQNNIKPPKKILIENKKNLNFLKTFLKCKNKLEEFNV